ncbi:MAG: zf-HC2 domain-containing protein [Gemmatimonadaceae bacterium]
MPPRSVCERVVRQLWPYLDGAVDESARGMIVAHLEACTVCASHFEFAHAFLDAVARSRTDVPPDDRLRGRVLTALSAEGFSLSA